MSSGQQNPPQLSSNLANLLNDMGASGAQAAQPLGDFIGTLADLSGAVGAVTGVISFVESFFQTDATDAALQNIETTIQKDFAELNATLAAQDIVSKLAFVAPNLSKATGLRDAFPSLVSQLPLAPINVTNQLENCADGIEALAPSAGNWVLPYSDRIFWTDSGLVAWPPTPWTLALGFQLPVYGQQAPAENADGTVFNYTYVLPAYLYALCIFVAVGSVIDPNFVKNWGDTVIRPAVQQLKAVHDQILANITSLTGPPVFWSGQNFTPWLTMFVGFDEITPNNLPYTTDVFSGALTPGLSLPNAAIGVTPFLSSADQLTILGANIEYGAVEKYSGFSSMALYSLVAPFSLQSNDNAPFNKFNIRVTRRVKQVYLGVGLLSIWNTMNSLNAIVGDPQLGTSVGAWSFKRDLLGLATAIGLAPKVSLLALAKYIQNTLPIDVPPVPSLYSFRALLDV